VWGCQHGRNPTAKAEANLMRGEIFRSGAPFYGTLKGYRLSVGSLE
jgi:hypothetical protein